MKRSWIGLFLLLLLLISGLILSSAMVRICQEDSQYLIQAAEAALQENWQQAAYLTARVRHSWDGWNLFRCAMADHGPAEEIEVLFSVLEIYGTARNKLSFAAVCREAAQRLEALGEAQKLDLHNLL